MEIFCVKKSFINDCNFFLGGPFGGSNNLSNSVNATDTFDFQFITQSLVAELKQQHQQNKMAAFFNFELLKYEFKYTQTPLVLNAFWSNDPSESAIQLDLDYVFKFRKHLSQCNFMIVIPWQSKVKLTKSDPPALVQETDNKLHILWQMSQISGDGKLMARFLVDQSDDSVQAPLDKFYQPVYAKFHVDNETLSQVISGFWPFFGKKFYFKFPI